LEKFNNEQELKVYIEAFLNEIKINFKKVEVIYSYGYDSLDREIKGKVKCNGRIFEFSCDEMLCGFKIGEKLKGKK